VFSVLLRLLTIARTFLADSFVVHRVSFFIRLDCFRIGARVVTAGKSDSFLDGFVPLLVFMLRFKLIDFKT